MNGNAKWQWAALLVLSTVVWWLTQRIYADLREADLRQDAQLRQLWEYTAETRARQDKALAERGYIVGALEKYQAEMDKRLDRLEKK